MTNLVPDAAIDAFNADGFTVLENVVDEPMLTMLREECAYFVGYTDAVMDAKKQEVMGITHRGKRYFISGRYRASSRLYRYVYGDLMAAITSAFLGPEVFLFNEQWVVKGPEQGMKFAWHQDSGYVKAFDPDTTHKPYLTCWCALDDMSEVNGTISVLPHGVAGTRNTIMSHRREPGTNDLIGYEGNEAGELVCMPAGSVAVFSSTSLHRSGPNTTDSQRRVYLTQYTAEPLFASSGELWAQAVPFVSQGRNVYAKDADFNAPPRTATRRRAPSTPRASGSDRESGDVER